MTHAHYTRVDSPDLSVRTPAYARNSPPDAGNLLFFFSFRYVNCPSQSCIFRPGRPRSTGSQCMLILFIPFPCWLMLLGILRVEFYARIIRQWECHVRVHAALEHAATLVPDLRRACLPALLADADVERRRAADAAAFHAVRRAARDALRNVAENVSLDAEALDDDLRSAAPTVVSGRARDATGDFELTPDDCRSAADALSDALSPRFLTQRRVAADILAQSTALSAFFRNLVR